MSDTPNTLFLRLEGSLQAWGDTSNLVIRRTMEAPTKSGVIGLICCAMGVRRGEASKHPIPERFGALRRLAERLLLGPETKDGRPRRTILGVLNTLEMAVRIDRAGTRWWDYHTVGAKIGILRADGKGIKRTGGRLDDPIETLLSRREYLCDASFLVALRGDSEFIKEVASAFQSPKWPLFFGRKSCPPSVPILVTRKSSDGTREPVMGRFDDLKEALAWDSQAWQPRHEEERPRDIKRKPLKTIHLDCLIERQPLNDEIAPPDAEVWYDSPVSFDPPVHEPRLVERLERDRRVEVPVGQPLQYQTPPPPRPQADYRNKEFRKRREGRLESDQGLCVFCKSPATTVQHVTYRRAGGNEEPDDLRSLCRLCHDAVTMIEYGLGMGLDRIDPCEPRWRDHIIAKRDEIRRWRSEEGRRRALRATPERLRRETLEEED